MSSFFYPPKTGTGGGGSGTVTSVGTGAGLTGGPITTSGTISLSLLYKSGTVSSGSFSGSPLKATVTFASPFGSTAYSITITGIDSRAWSYESKLAGSFVINANAAAALTGEVSWQAIASGET